MTYQSESNSKLEASENALDVSTAQLLATQALTLAVLAVANAISRTEG